MLWEDFFPGICCYRNTFKRNKPNNAKESEEKMSPLTPDPARSLNQNHLVRSPSGQEHSFASPGSRDIAPSQLCPKDFSPLPGPKRAGAVCVLPWSVEGYSSPAKNCREAKFIPFLFYLRVEGGAGRGGGREEEKETTKKRLSGMGFVKLSACFLHLLLPLNILGTASLTARHNAAPPGHVYFGLSL